MAGGHAFSQVGGAALVTTPSCPSLQAVKEQCRSHRRVIHTAPACAFTHPPVDQPPPACMEHAHRPYCCMTCALVHCATIYIVTLVLTHCVVHVYLYGTRRCLRYRFVLSSLWLGPQTVSSLERCPCVL